MRRAWRTFFASGAGFLLASVLSLVAGFQREDGAWVSFLLAATWGWLGVSSALAYRRARDDRRTHIDDERA